MPADREFQRIFNQLREQLNANNKRRPFLESIEQALQEEEFEMLLAPSAYGARSVAITADRPRNSTVFDYHLFDQMLVALDQMSGGTGLRKPINQLRIIQWRGSRRRLLTLLLKLGRRIPAVRARRLLVLRLIAPTVAHNLDPGIYMR